MTNILALAKNKQTQDLVLSVKLQLRKPLVQKLCFLPPKGVLHKGSSTIEDCLQLRGILHQKLSSIKGCPPLTVVFHIRSSSVKGHLTIKGCLQSKVI